MRKNAWGLFCPQYVCYGKPLKKHGSKSFALFVAVKHCGRFIMKGNRFYTSKATKRQRAALNFIVINLAENQSYCLCNSSGVK